MSNLVQKNRFELAGFEQAQVQLYKDAFCRGATDEELFFFMTVCKQTGLDPVKKQIHCVPRWDSKLRKNIYTPQTSVDGLRVLAERSGTYEGQTPPYWCGEDGVWKDVWLSSKPPSASKVGVYKKGCREAIWGIARWDSYVAKYYKDNSWHIGPMWEKMGDTMLAKCAESLALRKACPDDTQGLYTKEEMAQASKEGGEFEPEENEQKTDTTEAKRPTETTVFNSRAESLNARLAGSGKVEQSRIQGSPDLPRPTHPVEQPRAQQDNIQPDKQSEKLVEPTWEDFKEAKLEQAKEVEAKKNHWERMMTAGPMAGKTFKQFLDENGKDRMITMYKKSLENINLRQKNGEEINQNILDTVKDLELCLGELGVS